MAQNRDRNQMYVQNTSHNYRLKYEYSDFMLTNKKEIICLY